jgi:hypothetical protein
MVFYLNCIVSIQFFIYPQSPPRLIIIFIYLLQAIFNKLKAIRMPHRPDMFRYLDIMNKFKENSEMKNFYNDLPDTKCFPCL